MLKLAWNYMRYYRSQTIAIFVSIVLTASLLCGISSLIYSSQKSDIANKKTIYGDWHYYIETDKELYKELQSEEKEGYNLKKCGKMEIRDVVIERYPICFINADKTYREMAHRDLLEGKLPKEENEIAADRFVLSNLGFSGDTGDTVVIGEKEYIVTGILKSEWAAGSGEMEVFVSDTFEGRGSQTFVYLKFDENKKLYRQLDSFLNEYRLSADSLRVNDPVTEYLGGEAPQSIIDTIKFGLTDDEGNITYIILKLQSDYNLAYNGMILLLCFFSIFIIYSVFSISVSKRISEYGILKNIGAGDGNIGVTLFIELCILFITGYPLGCVLGNGILSIVYDRFSGVFSEEYAGGTSDGLSIKDNMQLSDLAGTGFHISWDAMIFGFIFLLVSLIAVAFLVVRSLRRKTLKETLGGDTSFNRRRKIYAMHNVDMAGVVVRKFMFSNRRKVIGILLSLSIGGCIFLCTTYMVENLKVHAELSMMSNDGLTTEYRVSLKSDSLEDIIPADITERIKTMQDVDDAYATKYTLGEITDVKNLEWDEYFDQLNADPYMSDRFGSICRQQDNNTYSIKYDVYGYDDKMIDQLDDFLLEGEISPEKLRNENQVIVQALMDGQNNYNLYGLHPGDKIKLRVPVMKGYSEELLKFEADEDRYIEKEFEIAAIVSRSLAKEKNFLNYGPWNNMQSIIMTNEQMKDNFGIDDYSFVDASPAEGADTDKVSGRILQLIRDVPKAVLQDYSTAIETQKNHLEQQQLFYSGIAVIMLVISLFHIANSMNHTILSKRREYGIMRAMGITDDGFYKMILKTGIMYGLMADIFIFLLYNLVLRRFMDYYMNHILQFLHLTSTVPGYVLIGIMILNIVIAIAAVMVPAKKIVKENIISEIN